MSLTSKLKNDFGAFDHFINFNQRFKKDTKVIVSDTMTKLYQETTSDSSFAVVLIGPHGVGKTTTLFWLSHQLEDKGAIAIPINKEVIKMYSAKPPKILLVDFNEINSTPLPDIQALRKLIIDVVGSGGKAIFAGSSSFYATQITEKPVSFKIFT